MVYYLAHPLNLNSMYKEEMYKHSCGLYVAHAPPWSIYQYQQDCLEKWDIIYITCRKIIDDNDKSEWAYAAFEIMAGLLSEGARWPAMLDHELDHLYGDRYKMTRDPYILFYACAVHLNRLQFIDAVKMKNGRRLKMWIWKKHLVGTRHTKGLYEWLELSQLWMHKREYTRQLVYYRATAAGSTAVLLKLNPISEQYLYTN